MNASTSLIAWSLPFWLDGGSDNCLVSPAFVIIQALRLFDIQSKLVIWHPLVDFSDAMNELNCWHWCVSRRAACVERCVITGSPEELWMLMTRCTDSAGLTPQLSYICRIVYDCVRRWHCSVIDAVKSVAVEYCETLSATVFGGRQHQIPSVPLTIGSNDVIPVSPVRDLGIYILFGYFNEDTRC